MREALGADAVVLWNRTNDDGTVEIVALADTDFAQIAPDAGEAASQGATAQSPSNPYAGLAPGAMSSNPYANGMPDVFSAVFGASPEVGAKANDQGRPASSDAAAIAAPRSAERPAFAARAAASNVSAPSASSAPGSNSAPRAPTTPRAAKHRARWPTRTLG